VKVQGKRRLWRHLYRNERNEYTNTVRECSMLLETGNSTIYFKIQVKIR